jgi:ribonuclease P protein component
MVVLWRPTSGPRRAGFAVGRQIKGAVHRNRTRRRLREAYRAARDAAPSNIDVVVIGRGAALEVPIATLIGEMRDAFTVVASRGTGR